MLKQVFYFLKGYVIIRIYGKFPERVLNVATAKNIICWDTKPISGGLCFKVSKKAYPMMEDIVKGCRCTMQTGAKIGLPFTAKRHKKRQALIWGVGLFFCVIFLFSSVLSEIRITGNEKISDTEILELLSECGISKGKFVYGIDTRKTVRQMYVKNDKIAWIGIEIRGNCALVEIAEKVEVPHIVPLDSPCNIVSDKDGLIEKIQVRYGIPMVKEGDAVYKEQLLVSGIADSSVVGVRYIHADAEILLRVWYEKNAVQNLSYTERVPTGNTKTRYEIDLFGYIIPLYFNMKPPFEKADVMSENIGLLRKHTYAEVTEISKKYTEEQALKIAQEEFEEEAKKVGEVQSITHTYQREGDSLNINFTAECLTEAGIKQEIERTVQDGENPAS